MSKALQGPGDGEVNCPDTMNGLQAAKRRTWSQFLCGQVRLSELTGCCASAVTVGPSQIQAHLQSGSKLKILPGALPVPTDKILHGLPPRPPYFAVDAVAIVLVALRDSC